MALPDATPSVKGSSRNFVCASAAHVNSHEACLRFIRLESNFSVQLHSPRLAHRENASEAGITHIRHRTQRIHVIQGIERIGALRTSCSAAKGRLKPAAG
jgi:hypothetical protein